jgi:hypothetical protein
MTTSDMKPGDPALKTKHRVSDEQRRLVLELRRRHLLREVAEATGLPLGTVKTLVSRSGAFRDNDQHRALFTLPPIKASQETLPSVPELPPQEVVTEAEAFCIEALRGLEANGQLGDFDKGAVADRFYAHLELMPHTLTDCLYELDYWSKLYWLRNAVDRDASDGPAESTARDWFVFGLLAEIRPRDKAEALAVFRYLVASDRDDMAEAEAILCNLIG